jgi:hypothetical protein
MLTFTHPELFCDVLATAVYTSKAAWHTVGREFSDSMLSKGAVSCSHGAIPGLWQASGTVDRAGSIAMSVQLADIVSLTESGCLKLSLVLTLDSCHALSCFPSRPLLALPAAQLLPRPWMPGTREHSRSCAPCPLSESTMRIEQVLCDSEVLSSSQLPCFARLQCVAMMGSRQPLPAASGAAWESLPESRGGSWYSGLRPA